MKKWLLSAAFCTGLVFSANAIESGDLHNDSSVNTEYQDHSAYEGLYFGGGVHAANLGVRSEYELLKGDSLDTGYSFENAKRDENGRMLSSSNTKLGGTVVLGFGKKLTGKRFYLGLEALLDCGPSITVDSIDRFSGSANGYDAPAKINGLIPSVGMRLGYVSASKMLTYLKVAASFCRSRLDYSMLRAHQDEHWVMQESGKIKNSKVSPEIALGFEKAFEKKATMRIEVAYVVGNKKTGRTYSVNVTGADKKIPFEANVELKKKDAVIIRTMLCWNVKLFNR